MKIEPFLLSSSLSLIEAQRLVRRICEFCKEKISLPPDALADVQSELVTIEKERWLKDVDIDHMQFFKGKGCARCGGTGYKGRLVIDELFTIDSAFQELIVQRFPMDRVREEAKKQGMLYLRQDGFLKAARGLTTIEEVMRTTQI